MVFCSSRTFASVLAFGGLALAQGVSIESVDPRGFVALEDVSDPRLSDNGAFLLFTSSAAWTNDDAGLEPDVFLRNRRTGQIVRVSVNSSGDSAISPDGQSSANAGLGLTADGRFTLFRSRGRNFVLGDDNATFDVFVHDRVSSQTVLASRAWNGAIGNGASSSGAISSDGRYVAFSSTASNLVPQDANGSVEDVFVRDLVAGTTELVAAGGPSFVPTKLEGLSADGRLVLVRVGGWLRLTDRVTGAVISVSVDSNGVEANGNVSAGALARNGRFVAFASTATNLDPSDLDDESDVFVRDLLTGVTRLASVGVVGAAEAFGPCSVSDDGRWVSFQSNSATLVAQDDNAATDSFVRDLAANVTFAVGVESGGVATVSGGASVARLTPDGRYVSFAANADELVAGASSGAHAYVRDLAAMNLPPISKYGAGSVNPGACTPTINAVGQASVAGPASLWVTASNMEAFTSGQFFWGLAPASIPFGNGTLLVAAPRVRTGVTLSSGAPGSVSGDCSGTYSFHFSELYMASFGLSAGSTLYGQYWQRFSTPTSSGVSLTRGIEFTTAP